MAVQTQIQTRRGTAASWTSTNPTLAAGEIGFESDTNKFKIGTGSTAWASLAYASNVSPLTTKGDLYTYSTDNTRLAVGANGETIVADSSTPTGLKWAAPATGMTNPMTTTGDTIYSSSGSTPARRAIGTTGQVLTVSGGVPVWADATAATTSYTLLNAGGTSLTSASTITVSSLSGYNKLFITIEAASSVTASTQIFMRINSANTNYREQWSEIIGGSSYDAGNFSAGSSTSAIFLGGMSNAAASAIRGGLVIDGANSTSVKVFSHWSGANNTTGQYIVEGGGVYTGTSVVSSITIYTTNASNFDAGTLYIYGAN
jgi:hypothetical protein